MWNWKRFLALLASSVLLCFTCSHAYAQNVVLTQEQWTEFKTNYNQLREAVMQLTPELEASQTIIKELRTLREEQRKQLSSSMDSLQILKNEMASLAHLESAKRVARKITFGVLLAGGATALGGMAFNDIRIASIGALVTVVGSAFALVIDL